MPIRMTVDTTAARPGPEAEFSLSSLTETPVSQPQYRNTPRSMPETSAPALTPNGLNHSSEMPVECGPGLAYTLMSATTAKMIRIDISKPSRIRWVRAESSMPFQQIHVSSTMKMTPRMVTSSVLAAALSRPNSWKP